MIKKLAALCVLLVAILMACAGVSGFTQPAAFLYDLLVIVPLIIIGLLAMRQNRTQPWQIWGVVIALGVVTIWLANFRSHDWIHYLSVWCDDYADQSWTDALRHITTVSNYTPFYNYFLIAIAHCFTGLGRLYAIKFVSFAFSLGLAMVVEAIIADLRQTRYSWRHVLWWLLFPPLLLEFTAWGQCDAIYSFFTLLAFHCALRRRSAWCWFWCGCAFAIKLQCFIIAPILLVLLIIKDADGQRYLRWRWCWLALLPYAINLLPALAGANWVDLCLIYCRQSGEYTALSMNCPNPCFLWNFLINGTHSQILSNLLLILHLIFTIVAVTMLLVTIFRHHHRRPLTPIDIVFYAMALSFMIVFWMPKMHDRFYFIATLCALIWWVAQPTPRHARLAAFIITGLTMAFFAYLIPLSGFWRGALLFPALIVYLITLIFLIREIKFNCANDAQTTTPPQN